MCVVKCSCLCEVEGLFDVCKALLYCIEVQDMFKDKFVDLNGGLQKD